MTALGSSRHTMSAGSKASILIACLVAGPIMSTAQPQHEIGSLPKLDRTTVQGAVYERCLDSLRSQTDSSAVHAEVACAHPDWGPVEMNIEAAWQLLRAPDPSKGWAGEEPGAGVVIGQVDTGYTLHPAVKYRLALADAMNTLKPRDPAQDTMSKGLLGFLTFGLLHNPAFRDPGHGTKTASIAIGDPRQAPNPSVSGWVTGVAPAARLIPVRGTKGPGLLVVGPSQAAKAICYLAGGVVKPDEEESGDLCHAEPDPKWSGKGLAIPRLGTPVQVISIARGAPTSENLLKNKTFRRVLDFARDRGIIIVAASGDHETFTVYPAESCAAISVGTSVISGAPWTSRRPFIGSPHARRADPLEGDPLGKGSPRRLDACGQASGLKIDVSAPGAGVWRAVTNGREGQYRAESPYGYGVGKGTSFSAPAVAGIAAMWLQYRQAEFAAKHYERTAIPYVFSYVLRRGGGARRAQEVCEQAKKAWNLASEPRCDAVQRAWMAEDGKTSIFGAGIVDALGVLTAALPDLPAICDDLAVRGGQTDRAALKCPGSMPVK